MGIAKVQIMINIPTYAQHNKFQDTGEMILDTNVVTKRHIFLFVDQPALLAKIAINF